MECTSTRNPADQGAQSLGVGPSSPCAGSPLGTGQAGSFLDPRLWPLGPYGLQNAGSGPPRLHGTIVRDLVQHSQPIVVVSRHSHTYLAVDGGLGARVPCVTSDLDGITQAARFVHRNTSANQDGEYPVVLAVDLGGSEAQSLISAIEQTGLQVMVVMVALRRVDRGGYAACTGHYCNGYYAMGY